MMPTADGRAQPELHLRTAARLDTPGGTPAPTAVLENLAIPIDDPSLMPDSVRAVYFFAFDHLMEQAVISRYVRGLQPFKVVKAPNFRLCWPYYYPPEGGGLPSLERSDSHDVWGLLYVATKRDFSLLERHLNVPNRYHRRSVQTVDRGDRRLSAFTYTLSLSDEQESAPSQDYLRRLIGAAENRGLPLDWVEHLRGLEQDQLAS
jgi:hypothetical protein